jgi:GNAT superfamily N-acetyltransferase
MVRKIQDAATANFVAHASWAIRATQSPGTRVETGPELTLVDSGLSSDTFNVVCAARLQQADVGETVERVRRHFAGVERPFSWWVSPGDEPSDLGARLAQLGLPSPESALAMSTALDAGFTTERLRKQREELRVVRVSSPEQLAVFARINAENWDPPDTIVEAYYRAAAGVLLGGGSPQRFFVAFLEDWPVAAVEITLAADVAGVYNLSTRAAHRRSGIGAAVLAHALEDARAEGYGMAVLQATAAGAGLYGRLGFTEFGAIAEHKPAVL